MDIDYSQKPYVNVPEDYSAPEPRLAVQGNDFICPDPLQEQYHSRPDDEFLGPQGIGKLFPKRE